jgi:Na+-driven multidrug efflux pump
MKTSLQMVRCRVLLDRSSAGGKALCASSPLKTVIGLLVGPFVSQLTQALFGFVETIWVEKATDTRGVSAISTSCNFDTLPRAFGFFVNAAASSEVSALFGGGQSEVVPQVFADLFRLVIVFAFMVPAMLVPIMKPR